MGRPPAEVEAEQTRQYAAFWARYAEWVESPQVRVLDLRTLPRGEIAASYPPGPTTLDGAVRKADRIVEGTVSAVDFQPNATTMTTLTVARVGKGPTARQLQFVQDGIAPDEDWTGATLMEGGAPFVLPGDRVVVFLNEHYTLPFIGLYRVTEGTIDAHALNPFGDAVRGMPVEAFLRTVHARATRDSGK